MNAQDLAPIEQQASRNAAKGWGWCFVHPSQALELARAVRERDEIAVERDEARARLAEIKALLCVVLCEWADHHRAEERELLKRIEELCESGQTGA